MGQQQHKMSLDRLLSRKKSDTIIHIFAIYLNAGQDGLSDGQWIIVVHLGWSLPAVAHKVNLPFSLCFCNPTSVNLKYAHIPPSAAGTRTVLPTADLTLMYWPSQWPHGGWKHSCLILLVRNLHHPVVGGRLELDLNTSGTHAIRS